ncbi:MAG: hypothetical protein IIA33_04390, partial [Planctomycetes bacterium]|nr:hypothetical protein [Planctomycetota bacterium]
ATAEVTLTAISEIENLQFGLYDTDQGSCAVVDEIVGSSTTLGCVPNSVTAVLDPGIWVVLVTTPFFEGQPCPGENEYQVTLTVDPPAACP